MDFLNSLNNLSLNDPYLQHALFALASLALGLLGMLLGQRLTNGKTNLVFGLVLGGLTVFLLFTPYGYLAPGWLGVFVLSYLASGALTKLVSGSGDSGSKAPASKAPAPKA